MEIALGNVDREVIGSGYSRQSINLVWDGFNLCFTNDKDIVFPTITGDIGFLTHAHLLEGSQMLCTFPLSVPKCIRWGDTIMFRRGDIAVKMEMS